MADLKELLHHYLRLERESLVTKLDGLGERQARWPLTPTGTNLLGLVRHLTYIELGYFGDTFGRPHGVPELDFDADPQADWVAEEPMADVIAAYRRAWEHSDATIDALELDSPGAVPWWSPGKRDVTLGRILVHVTTETARHAGHADIVRELTDGATGLFAAGNNMPDVDWAGHVDRVRAVAERYPD